MQAPYLSVTNIFILSYLMHVVMRFMFTNRNATTFTISNYQLRKRKSLYLHKFNYAISLLKY